MVTRITFTPTEGRDTVGGIPNQVGNDRERELVAGVWGIASTVRWDWRCGGPRLRGEDTGRVESLL